MKVSTRIAATAPAVMPARIESAPRAGADRALLDHVEGGGQRTGAQQHGEVVGGLRREAAGDLARATG